MPESKIGTPVSRHLSDTDWIPKEAIPFYRMGVERGIIAGYQDALEKLSGIDWMRAKTVQIILPEGFYMGILEVAVLVFGLVEKFGLPMAQKIYADWSSDLTAPPTQADWDALRTKMEENPPWSY